MDEADALSRTRRLKNAGIIRQISGIFDSGRLGYTSTLVAMKLDQERIDIAADIISEHPGVSHNYGRDHDYNLWFTLTLPSRDSIEAEVSELARRAEARRTLILPALRRFKIGVELDLEQGVNTATSIEPTTGDEGARTLTDEDLACVRVLQQDLPLEAEPFRTWAEALGVSENELFARANDLQDSGVMRRFAAVLRHRKAGFAANGMICWRIPEEQLPDLGYRLASYPQVSHCYQRPVYPDWPYSVFSMVHAVSREQCEEIARQMSHDIDVSEYVILYSTREYKKERVRY